MALILNSRLSAVCSLLLLGISVNAATSNGSSVDVASSVLSSASIAATSSLVSSAVSSVVSSTAASSVLSVTTSVASNATSVASVTSAVPTTTSSDPPTETTLITFPISSYSFSSFPVPSASPIPGVFPSASINSPPPPGSQLIPDFGPAWAQAKAKAKTLISSWTVEEKVTAVTGAGWQSGRCVGNIAAVGDEWPGLCLEDGPLAVRGTDFATVFPAGINAAATWNRTLIRARGQAIGEEFKGKGVHVGLGPMMNLGRIAQGGRNWEGLGVDPFLSGEAAYETVLGWQAGGAQACAKHFIDNEQEYLRQHESSHVDDRTQHEVYLRPFLRSVQAGVASVMCSYNQVNASWACENDQTLNQILKGELGFQGYVMSDWGGHHSTLAAVGGLDMSMPGDIALSGAGLGESWWGPNLTAFVDNGTIAETRLDDMVERIVGAWYLLGQDDDYPDVSFNVFDPTDPATNTHVDVQGDHFKVVRKIGAASTVLLKNVAGALPLRKPRSLAVIGNDSGPSTRGPNGYPYRQGDDGTLAIGWGSGAGTFPYLITPLEAIQQRAREDHASVSWFLDNWDLAGAANTAVDQDVALVFVNADSGEGTDRQNLTLWVNGDNLINAVAAVNPNTIVVVHSVGPVILEQWIDNPNVTAVLWAGLPGQESGNSLVDVLYGAVSPSGRLPYTIAKRLEDYGAQPVTGGNETETILIEYTDGLNVDYRHFDANGIEPRFEFGFGLSYTEFAYSNLGVRAIQQNDGDSADLENDWAAGTASPNVEGGSTAIWLHRPAFEVSFTIKNTGKVKGGEIPQLYLHFPSGADEPPSVLRGFSDVLLESGQSKTVTITLSRFDLSIWDVVAQGWRKPDGEFTLSLGASSRDFRLNGTIPL